MKLLVLGGGVAGLATALAAGRGGHQVVLVERDTDTPAGDAGEVFGDWQRTGVAQFRQPHNFLGLGRRLLRDRAPDVYQDLLAAGAVEVEQFRFLAGAAPSPGTRTWPPSAAAGRYSRPRCDGRSRSSRRSTCAPGVG